jgi:xylan 1,4-beta-xylosidase
VEDLVPDARFIAKLETSIEKLPHDWEHTVGSGHATLALRADWRAQLTRCHRELGFRHVRFHGILSDDVGTLMCENDALVYSFFNANSIVDFLLSIGMRPFVELSFMPSTLASGDKTVFHYRGNVTPPADFAAWGTLLDKLARNWIERYGAEEVRRWFFEVWNEPNLDAFWTGSREEYFRLYETSVRALKKVDPRIRVGGPATAKNAWIPEFLDYCSGRDLPVDFVSTHHYPTDAFGKPGDATIDQLAASRRSVLREEAAKASEESRGIPLYYTEWCTSSNPFDELHDRPYAAAFIIKTVLERRGLTRGYSYWTFSDLFEENYFSSAPFHGGFGLLTIHGIPKPAYRAFALLHALGGELVRIEGTHPTVDVWVTRREGELRILATNSALPRHPIRRESVSIAISGLSAVKSAYLARIDETHANARAAWEAMGCPAELSRSAVESLEIASALVESPVSVTLTETGAQIEFVLPAQGTASVRVEMA